MGRGTAAQGTGTIQMVAGLVDSSIIIDILRLQQTSQIWLANQPRLGVASVVWLEVIQGASNRQKQNQAITILKRFQRIEHTEADFDQAISYLTQFNLSHNVGGNDCLIASVSHRLQLPLYTTNLKHFAPLLGALAQKPY